MVLNLMRFNVELSGLDEDDVRTWSGEIDGYAVSITAIRGEVKTANRGEVEALAAALYVTYPKRFIWDQAGENLKDMYRRWATVALKWTNGDQS